MVLMRLALPSRGEALPPLPPLRTVRARFRAHGSSLKNAPLRTRFHHRKSLAMKLSVAMRMQQHTV